MFSFVHPCGALPRIAHPRLLVITIAIATVLLVAPSTSLVDAQTLAPNGTSNSTPRPPSVNATNRTTTRAPVKKVPELTWQGIVTVVTIFVLLVALMTKIIACLPAMIVASLFFWFCGIIDQKDLLAGLSNSSVVTICLLFICVDPIAELPLVKKLVGKCLGGESANPIWARFKIVLLCLLTSSFLNNIPQVAVLTNLIKNHCREHNQYPSQYLMPMDFATLIGNYALIGTSTNLIVNGIMTKSGMKSMSFFELAKLNGPFAVVVLAYLVFAPYLLLPRDKGGMFRIAKNVALNFVTKLRVEPGSRLIGVKVKDFHLHMPDERTECVVAEVHRDGENVVPLPEDTIIELGDILVMTGSPSELRSSATILGLAWIPADIVSSTAPIVVTEPLSAEPDEKIPTTSEPIAPESEVADREKTPEVELKPTEAEVKQHSEEAPRVTPSNTSIVTPRPKFLSTSFAESTGNNASFHERTEQARSFSSLGAAMAMNRRAVDFDTHTTLFEAVLSSRCPCIGATVASGEFQLRYNASVLAARDTSEGVDLTGDALQTYTLESGDVLLILAESNFKSETHDSGDFVIINSFESEEDDEWEQHYVRVPSWFPCGHELPHKSDKLKYGKVIAVPRWYPYLVIPIFVAMISCAIAEVAELVICALCACIAIVLLGLTTTDKAIQSIEASVYIMVAFSFGIGSAVEKSGFAAFLGFEIKEAQVESIGLLYIISVVSAVLANLITDKASVQVIIPIVIAIYRQIGEDPLGACILSLCVCTQALCTPYGFATNLMVMGPGGYEPVDFVKFGMPLNLLGVAILPLLCWGIYYS